MTTKGDKHLDIKSLELMVRVLNFVPTEGDLVAILIKGHLIVEEQLNAALKNVSKNPQCIEDARLRFEQLMYLAKSHYQNEDNSWLWGAIKKLNKVRNQLAHQLEPKNVPELISGFLEIVSVDTHDVRSIEEELQKAIAMVAGYIYELYENDN